MSEIQDQQQTSIDKAVAEGGAYEILRKRLTSLGQELNQKTEALNQERLSEFGKSDMSIISRIRKIGRAHV